MTDDLSADIAALLRTLDEADAGASALEARLVIATDWSKGAMPLTVLRAFRTLVPTNAPIRLVFAVPHEPTQTDAACVQILVDEVGGAAVMEGLEVESFDDVIAKPYDAALVPAEDPEQNLVQLGGFILRMRDLMRRYEAAHGNPVATAAVAENAGDAGALRERLDAFVS